jgi:subtilisin family serine protease
MRRLARSFALGIVVTVIAAPARGATDPNDLTPQQWALAKIGASAAWPVADGTGITVAVVDTGVDYGHDDLRGHLLPGHDFVDNDDDAQDADGHGTHVSGIIAALHGNGGTNGVAPGAKILPVRVLDENGFGDDDGVVAGIKWAVDHGAKVINLSLGDASDQVFGPSLSDAVNDAWKAGSICVIAAGNEFVTSSAFTDEPAVIVTATNRSDGSPSYASGVGDARWGIAAPGGEIPTPVTEQDAIISTYWVNGEKDEYAYLAGTSQAAPHVSAALAILLSTGKFTPAQAVQRLLDTAKDIGDPGRDTLYGAGRLDIAAAMRGIDAASPGTSSTTAASTGGGGPATTATSPSSATTGLPLPNLSVPTVLPDGPVESPEVRGPEVSTAAGAASDHHRSGRTVPTVLAALALVGATAGGLRRWRGQAVTDDE